MTFSSLIKDLFGSKIVIVLILLAQRVWLPAMVKSKLLGQSSSTKKLLLLDRLQERYKPIYQISLVAYMAFVIILAFLKWNCCM